MDRPFTRRSFIQTASVAGLAILAGCGGNNSTDNKTVSRPEIIGIVSDYPQETSSSSGSATISQDTSESGNSKEVKIEGSIITEGTCQVATFDGFEYKSGADTAIVTIGTKQDSSRYEQCDSNKTVRVKYRLRVEFDTIPEKLQVKNAGKSSVVGEKTLDTGSN